MPLGEPNGIIQLPRTALGSTFSHQCLSQGWVARSLAFSFFWPLLNVGLEALNYYKKEFSVCEDYSNREFQLTPGWQFKWDTQFGFICGDLQDAGWRRAPSLFVLIKRSS